MLSQEGNAIIYPKDNILLKAGSYDKPNGHGS